MTKIKEIICAECTMNLEYYINHEGNPVVTPCKCILEENMLQELFKKSDEAVKKFDKIRNKIGNLISAKT